MTAVPQVRIPRGVRTGGQFAADPHPESDVALASEMTPAVPPARRWSLTYWQGDIRLATDADLQSASFRSRTQAEARADQLAAAGYHVQVENWSSTHPQDELNRGWALVATRDPAGDPNLETVAPRTLSDLRKALSARRRDSGRSHEVVVTSEATARLTGSLVVRGPADGSRLTVRVRSGFAPLEIVSGDVEVHAESSMGNAVYVRFGARADVQMYPDRKVSTTTDPGGHTVVRVAEGCHGLQHVEAGGVLEVLGDMDACQVHTSGDGRGRRATVCAQCRQTVSIGDDGALVHPGGGPCPRRQEG